LIRSSAPLSTVLVASPGPELRTSGSGRTNHSAPNVELETNSKLPTDR
jgi:hypothetical protein